MKLAIKEFYRPCRYVVIPHGLKFSQIKDIEANMYLKPIDRLAEVEFRGGSIACCKLLVNRNCFEFTNSNWVYPNNEINKILRALEID